MKKIIVMVSVITILLTSCNMKGKVIKIEDDNNYILTEEESKAFVLMNETSISKEELQIRANSAIVEFSNDDIRGNSKSKKLKNIIKLNEIEGISVYAYNYENEIDDEVGYVLLADDNRFSAPLVISNKGNLDVEIENPTLEYVLSLIPSYMEKKLDDYDNIPDQVYDSMNKKLDKISSSNRSTSRNTTWGEWYESKVVERLLVAKMYQQYPYNKFAPYWTDGVTQAVAGCVAIAMAQIIYYHESPNVFRYFPNAHEDDFSVMEVVDIDWDTIGRRSSPVYSYEEYDALRKLIRECGNRVDMDWEQDEEDKGSSASSKDVPKALSSFGYNTNDLVDFSTQPVWNNLDNGLPVYVSGADEKITYYNDDGSVDKIVYPGHAWVVDGYLIRSKDLVLDGTSTVVYRLDEGYLHCNWGWKSKDLEETWCLTGIFDSYNTLTRGVHDPNEVDNYYQYNVKMITDIQPR